MESFAMLWWLWIVLGLILFLGELLTPGGFYIVFFGISAILVGLLNLAGFSMGLAMEGLVFAAAGVAGLLFFRKPLMERFGKLSPNLPVDNLTDETAFALDDVAPNAFGKVELRGTTWNAQNLDSQPIQKSARCRVERVEGLTLFVRNL